MQMSIIPSSLIAVMSASVWLIQPSAGAAATAQCLAGPGAAAPRGQHWYYRVDRSNNRHCWYLDAVGLRIQAHEVSHPAQADAAKDPALLQTVFGSAAPQPGEQPPEQPRDTAARRAQLPPAAAATPAASAVSAAAPAVQTAAAAAPEFAERWPQLPRPMNLAALKFSEASNSYAEPPVSAAVVEPQAGPRWPILEADAAASEQRATAKPSDATGSATGSTLPPVRIALGIVSLMFAACGIGLGLSTYRPA